VPMTPTLPPACTNTLGGSVKTTGSALAIVDRVASKIKAHVLSSSNLVFMGFSVLSDPFITGFKGSLRVS